MLMKQRSARRRYPPMPPYLPHRYVNSCPAQHLSGWKPVLMMQKDRYQGKIADKRLSSDFDRRA